MLKVNRSLLDRALLSAASHRYTPYMAIQGAHWAHGTGRDLSLLCFKTTVDGHFVKP